MKTTFARVATAATFVLAAPLLAVSAMADEPGEGAAEEANEEVAAAEAPAEPAQQVDTLPGAAPAPAPAPEPAPEPAPAAPVAEEEEEERIICRSIRLDASSRRKTRVCRTEEGWRELNQRR